jgi:hypothetical protein
MDCTWRQRKLEYKFHALSFPFSFPKNRRAVWVSDYFCFIAYIHYFEELKLDLLHHAVCVSVYPPCQLLNA